ncbi:MULTISPECIES: DNA/RNA non-specific endonuclease [unclassified Enterococcus]|uniref:DNA/RNA non-specific endonuclease n=1 Tax=unclassified Enterococcus TaxID=2608891 RepID=UPI00201B4085|nr:MULTISPECIES: DNA/RNA non-specific endonuclease [unclassified Enterococcus]
MANYRKIKRQAKQFQKMSTTQKWLSIFFVSILLFLAFNDTALQKVNQFVNQAEPTSFKTKALKNQANVQLTYAGNPVVTINQGVPNFEKSDLDLSKGAWQAFSTLDQYNRVGVANAMLHKSLMPKKQREAISNVYPSGWHQKKIDQDTWLYNRSHLIAHQLTGENANWQNLFTGTQQLNQIYMVTYEQEVASYLKTTNHHVRYRVTPYFKDDELVCRGVQLEAESIEDQQISFNVFIYNVQANFQINYTNGTSQKVQG